MGSTKVKSLREQFEEEYIATVEPANNKNGFKIKYVYYGNWYLWNLPEEELKKEKTRILLLTAVDSILYFLAAVWPTDLNSYALVAFPGIVAFLAIILKLLGILQFVLAKYRTSKSNFFDAGRKIRAWSVIQIGSTTVCSLGCFYYLIAYGFHINRLIPACLYALDTLVTILVFRRFIKIPTKAEKNDTLEHVTLATPNGNDE